MPSASKYSGLTSNQLTGVAFDGSTSGRPSTDRAPLSQQPIRGVADPSPTDRRPGTVATASRARSSTPTAVAPVRYVLVGASSHDVTRPSRAKPGSHWRSRPKVLVRRPAPTRRMRASAISATTSEERSRVSRELPWRRPLSVVPRSIFDACRAGANPKSRAVATDSSTVKSATRPSIATSSSRGMLPGAISTNALVAHDASSRPRNPPMRARTRLSVRSWRTRRPPPAPSDERTANSGARRVARTSSRPATLAQAMSRTNAVVAMKIHSVARAGPTV